jgi:hypothetical protein
MRKIQIWANFSDLSKVLKGGNFNPRAVVALCPQQNGSNPLIVGCPKCIRTARVDAHRTREFCFERPSYIILAGESPSRACPEQLHGTCFFKQVGVSENSVPLNPMVNDHYPILSLLNGYNWQYTLFSDKPKWC